MQTDTALICIVLAAFSLYLYVNNAIDMKLQGH